MALNKEMCYEIGQINFEKGSERPIGDSWQAKALQKGWDDAKFAKDCIDAGYGKMVGVDTGSPEGDKTVHIKGEFNLTTDKVTLVDTVLVDGTIVEYKTMPKPTLISINGMPPARYNHIQDLKRQIELEPKLSRKLRLFAKVNKLERIHSKYRLPQS